MKKVILCALLVVLPPTASAWGEREQGILAGIAGTLLLQNINQPRYGYAPYQPPVVYHEQHIHHHRPVYPAYQYRPMYKFVDIYVPECGCYRSVKVPVY
jgi:hypothetical protein